MCGIVGIYNLNNEIVDQVLLQQMNNAQIHRGPDNGQIEVFGNCGLGHRRLSIIDLSKEANQPMNTDDSRYWIVFNGEIYNYLELKKELNNLGIGFNTNSDTEVLLKAYIFWGKEAFSKFNGMFALAIFDNVKKTLLLARDQFGIKPLYFYHDENTFIFASEIKSILVHPKTNISLNNQAITEYMWYGNPLGNITIYNEVNEVNPGSICELNNDGFYNSKYFNIHDAKEIKISEDEAIEEVKRLLDNSIKRHLISDVPVGVFLSGGIDSSAITALASKYYGNGLQTFCVGFDFIQGPNELEKAKVIAQKYGTLHQEVHISGGNLIETIEALVNSHDEPFGDAANIPLYLLTKELKGQLKVVLQGDGGDEFFGGYSRYKTINSIKKWKFIKNIIPFTFLSNNKNTKIIRFNRFLEAITQKEPHLRNALLLTMESSIYNPLNIFTNNFKNQLFNLDPFERYKDVYNSYSEDIEDVQALFYTDTQIILKDTFLEKVDKSTMANSMEIRVPFLDKELCEFMLSIPASLKVKNGEQKYLLKKALKGVVPLNILYGKKTGFSVPYQYWLNTSLKHYFLEQISTKKVKEMIDYSEVSKLFEMHKKGVGNYGFLLWKTLNFAIWLNKTK